MYIRKVSKHYYLALTLWIGLLPWMAGCRAAEPAGLQPESIPGAAETESAAPVPSSHGTLEPVAEPTHPPGSPSEPIAAPGRLTNGQAAKLITGFLAEKKPGLVEAAALEMMEVPAQRVWEELQAQLWIVMGGAFQNEAFLIRHEQVTQLGVAAGGKGLTSLAVADLDQNGQSELLFSYNAGLGPGFGTETQTRVGMYAPISAGSSPVAEANLAYLGIAGLKFEDPTTVNLAVIEPQEASQVLRYLEVLGQFSIEHTEAGQSLMFQIDPDLADDLKQKLIVE